MLPTVSLLSAAENVQIPMFEGSLSAAARSRRAAELLVGRIERTVSGKAREVVLQTTIRSHDPDSGPYELGA